MKINAKGLSVAGMVIIIGLTTGCAGFSGTGSVSPATFLLMHKDTPKSKDRTANLAAQPVEFSQPSSVIR